MRAIVAGFLIAFASNLSAFSIDIARATELQLERVANGLEQYQKACNRLPTTAEFPSVLISSDATCWSGPYISLNQSKDRWGRILIYRPSPGGAGFTLKSSGMDGVQDTADDIVFGDKVKAWRSMYREHDADDTLPGGSIAFGALILGIALLAFAAAFSVFRKVKRTASDSQNIV